MAHVSLTIIGSLVCLLHRCSASNTDSGWGNDNKAAKIRLVRCEHLSKPGDLVSGSTIEREAEINDAGMGQSVAEDQLAEITIIGDEDTPLGLGKMQYLTVVDAARIVLDDGRDIMPLIS